MSLSGSQSQAGDKYIDMETGQFSEVPKVFTEMNLFSLKHNTIIYVFNVYNYIPDPVNTLG